MDVPFLLTLNSSTLRPYNLDLESQLRVTAEAGFAGIEIWMRDLQAYMARGNRPDQIRFLAEELGISVVNGIAFFKWTDRNPKTRKAGLEQAAHEITVLAETGCTKIAAPPAGDVTGLSATEIAANYERLLAISRPMGVDPVLEFWGRASRLHTVNEAVEVLDHLVDTILPRVKRSADLESGKPPEVTRPSVLLDLYHMYTGGSEIADLERLDADQIGLVHINDYPDNPPRETITDADRVMPGTGVAPAAAFLSALHTKGYTGPLSVELFRSSYGHSGAIETAREAYKTTHELWNRVANGAQ
ncbi:MAG: sugar phosphate isomerase/epimerase family protein [Spirochaetales bacterium]